VSWNIWTEIEKETSSISDHIFGYFVNYTFLFLFSFIVVVDRGIEELKMPFNIMVISPINCQHKKSSLKLVA